jgi:hypothetical protein
MYIGIKKKNTISLLNCNGIHCYESAEELWKENGLPVAMSVLDHPRP